jgi:hypothetical protein
MRGPKPPAIDLSDAERGELDGLLRRHSTAQQVALRARIVIAAAAGYNNAAIARQVGVAVIITPPANPPSAPATIC